MTIDLESPDSIYEPARYFAAAREHGDVQWSTAQRAWVVLSHVGVEACFRDADTLSADREAAFRRAVEGRSAAFAKVADLLAGWMNFRDPPAHTRLREPVKRAFTPRAIAALEPEIRAIVDGTLAQLDGGCVDLSAQFARPIPAEVIAAILGVPRGERERFQAWSDDITKIVFATAPGRAPEATIANATAEFIAFFSALLERERAEPTGSLLTVILENASGELSEMDLVGACTLLLFGGHETTTTLLSNALALLLERPHLLEWARAHPEADESLVEEFMRTVGPARAMPRKVQVTHERGGRLLEAGQNVYLCITAANHDPEVFPEPERFDPLRTPNPHLGFGWGLHYCLGASLARLEARIALRMLLERFGTIAPAQPVPRVRASAMGFGRRPLPARVSA